MKKPKELDDTQLKNSEFPNSFSFRTTAQLEPLDGIVGQERAVRAFDFGLEVKMKGYNIYMAGPSGTGKTGRWYSLNTNSTLHRSAICTVFSRASR